MIDHRMETFLTLCDRMNYRQTAEQLMMTQPAVTQHIQFLEGEYRCKLFTYSGRQLRKTEAGAKLERYARSAQSNELSLRQSLHIPPRRQLRLGATKSIGDYVLGERLVGLVGRRDLDVSLAVDNTKNLLHALDHQQLDIALIEGYFDKSAYGHRLMAVESLVGICSKNSPLAGREVDVTEIFGEMLIIREVGSGTRAVFEAGLHQQNYSLASFPHTAQISSMEAIKTLAVGGVGVSFVYQSVADSEANLATFTIRGLNLKHEFNYVYLLDTYGEDLVGVIEG